MIISINLLVLINDNLTLARSSKHNVIRVLAHRKINKLQNTLITLITIQDNVEKLFLHKCIPRTSKYVYSKLSWINVYSK